MNEEPEQDRRSSVRARKAIDAEYSANCPWIRARLDDLSEQGAFLDTQHPVAEGSEILLRFPLPDEHGRQHVVRCRARVVWKEAMVGVGLEFVELDEETRERIRYVVAADLFGWGD